MRTHRDLIAWQLSRDLSLQVHRWSEAAWSPHRRGLHDQLRRAAVSVSLNIAEGHAYGPGGKCRHHLCIAYGSAVETVEVLDLLAALGENTGSLPELAQRTKAITLALWRKTPAAD
jgi:four helix bundle protein